jgi:hypothetical protein
MNNYIFTSLLMASLLISCSDDSAQVTKEPNFSLQSSPSSLVSDFCPNRHQTAGGLQVVGGMDSVEREGISVRILSGNKGADGLNVINSSCSATFIGPNTILTAAHCLYAKDIVYLVKEFFKTDSMGKKSLYSIRQKPVLSWKTMPGYVNNNKTFTGIAPIVNDIALIQVSQEDGISSWAEISSSGPSLCDEVNWIGYGSTSHQDNRALGLRKIGKNEIETIEHESGRSVIMFQSRSEGETPNESQSGSGDSGAGLFNSNGELVGVVNASTKNAIKFYDNDEKDPMYRSYAANLHDEKVKEWLQSEGIGY